MDTDGDVTLLVPWLNELGIAGVLPLERQAGVDGLELRQQFPDFLFIGHFDKMTMNRGGKRPADCVPSAVGGREGGRVEGRRMASRGAPSGGGSAGVDQAVAI